MNRRIFLVAILSLLAIGIGRADENDLRGGVFIAHYVPEIEFSTDEPPEGWCGVYEAYAIGGAAEQNNRIDVSGESDPVCWYVLAAWGEEKTWCGTEFGLGDYDQNLFAFIDFGPCFAQGEGLEITSPDWPAPETGTAFCGFGEWQGNYVPVYWFGGYAYATAGPGQIPLDVNTNYQNPTYYSAGFANCLSVPIPYEVECLGVLGINMDGIPCDPGAFAPVAVCCYGESFAECAMNTSEECFVIGGVWHPEWDSCDQNPCAPTPVNRATWGGIKALYR